MDCISPQVVYGQLEIVESLTEHLRTGTSLSLQPTLELLAALATDLQHDVGPTGSPADDDDGLAPEVLRLPVVVAV